MHRFCSLFSQILKFIPRTDFEGEVRKLHAERHARGVSGWQQFVSMLFCPLGRAHSLREIEQGLRSCEDKRSHWGIEVLGRSSWSDVNEHRPWQRYQNVFHLLFGRFQTQLALPGSKRTRQFRFKNTLVSLDSSVIDWGLKMYDWARFRTTQGAIKLHQLLDHDGYLPSCWVITTGKVHEVTLARTLTLQPGTILVDDRGYNDYQLVSRWSEEGVYFVTRLKDNAVYRVVRNQPVHEKGNHPVRKDQIIRFTGPSAKQNGPQELRWVSFYAADQKREFQLLTNHFKLAASTIAALYQDRWSIALFFKALTQNLTIKTFVGTSPNAVKTQVWTALMTMLRLRFRQLKAQWGWSLSNGVALLRMNLFTPRDLWAWLHNPCAVPPDPNAPTPVPMVF